LLLGLYTASYVVPGFGPTYRVRRVRLKADTTYLITVRLKPDTTYCRRSTIADRRSTIADHDHRPLTNRPSTIIRIGIIADDLTGAADAAVPFVRAGWTTELQLRPGSSCADVVAVSTDSRALNARDAAAVVTTAVKRYRDAGITHLYKKIDSTLRGQVKAEVQAAREGWSRQAIAVVCPAFPAAGRTVVNGQLRVDGQPVAETAVAADPVTPVNESHIPTLLGASHVKPNSGDSAEQLAKQIRGCAPIVVVDATSEHDLQVLANAVRLLGSDAVAVGSAGLARHLASVWAAEKGQRIRGKGQTVFAPRRLSLTPSSLPAIVIVTSLQDVARRQAAAVLAAGGRHHQPAAEDLIDAAAWARWSGKVLSTLKDVDTAFVLTSPVDRGNDHLAKLIPKRFAELAARSIIQWRGAPPPRRYAQNRQWRGAPPSPVPCAAAAHGARSAARDARNWQWGESGGVSGVVVTGGDGARALVDALDATGINLYDEVMTGVPIGTLVGGAAEGLRVVTKAGGFGGDDTLLQAVEAVRYCRYDEA
jgi:D-threonate/D-erythronate kinase